MNKKYKEITLIKSRLYIKTLARENELIYVSAWKKPKVVSAKFVKWMNDDTVKEMIDKGQLMHVIKKTEGEEIKVHTGLSGKPVSYSVYATTPNDESKEVYKQTLQEVSKERKDKVVTVEAPIKPTYKEIIEKYETPKKRTFWDWLFMRE